MIALPVTREQPVAVNCIAEMRKGVEMVDLRESSYYQLIHEEGVSEGEKKGVVRGIRETILSLGTERFGVASPEIEAALEGITDRTKLKSIRDRLLKAASWEELLAAP